MTDMNQAAKPMPAEMNQDSGAVADAFNAARAAEVAQTTATTTPEAAASREASTRERTAQLAGAAAVNSEKAEG